MLYDARIEIVDEIIPNKDLNYNNLIPKGFLNIPLIQDRR